MFSWLWHRYHNKAIKRSSAWWHAVASFATPLALYISTQEIVVCCCIIVENHMYPFSVGPNWLNWLDLNNELSNTCLVCSHCYCKQNKLLLCGNSSYSYLASLQKCQGSLLFCFIVTNLFQACVIPACIKPLACFYVHYLQEDGATREAKLDTVLRSIVPWKELQVFYRAVGQWRLHVTGGLERREKAKGY